MNQDREGQSFERAVHLKFSFLRGALFAKRTALRLVQNIESIISNHISH